MRLKGQPTDSVSHELERGYYPVALRTLSLAKPRQATCVQHHKTAEARALPPGDTEVGGCDRAVVCGKQGDRGLKPARQ